MCCRISIEQIRDEIEAAMQDLADALDRLQRLLNTIKEESGPEELGFTHSP